MTKFEILFAICVSLVVAVFQALSFDGFDVRLGAAVFIFIFYCCVVLAGSEADKKRRRERRLPLLIQIVLGVFTALSIAFIGRASENEYAVALGIGFFGGATAHWWVKFMEHA